MESSDGNRFASYALVTEQLKDLISLNEDLPTCTEPLKRRIEELEYQLMEEQSSHGETRRQLDDQTHKLNFALGEIDILTRRLEATHTTFKSRFSEAEVRVASQLLEKKQLTEECEELQGKCRQQEIVLSKKDDEIQELKQRLMRQKQSHKRHTEELQVQMQQEAYMGQLMDKDHPSSKSARNRHNEAR